MHRKYCSQIPCLQCPCSVAITWWQRTCQSLVPFSRGTWWAQRPQSLSCLDLQCRHWFLLSLRLSSVSAFLCSFLFTCSWPSLGTTIPTASASDSLHALGSCERKAPGSGSTRTLCSGTTDLTSNCYNWEEAASSGWGAQVHPTPHLFWMILGPVHCVSPGHPVDSASCERQLPMAPACPS